MERSFGTVQELNKYRKELARELGNALESGKKDGKAA